MTVLDVTRNKECIDERARILSAYQSFVSELEYINEERGLLLQEATRTLEEAAAEKLRKQIRAELLHHGN
ncbi:MAG: hypothetical protein A2494_02765 [Candidatus Lloydbacteria bacterium RIFOXYC12_FULL_46_25]|uniref:Uncharacterized protein n=1 Tax=Candidatus Lloydbacteria bacterium RIFOXYC12_FULL_46_25 TaxID=1798670 RepID=A0A1G2DZP4_9BACT|nr:MAG: hypothetical protein A2494_02765 [Candidatus Lloydbacteria bacterium RIFOXYC12_FULL_46_25]